MKLELTEQQARLIKHIISFETDEYFKEERTGELQAWLGDEKGQEVANIIYKDIDNIIEMLDVEDTSKDRSYEMEMARIYIPNIYELEEKENSKDERLCKLRII